MKIYLQQLQFFLVSVMFISYTIYWINSRIKENRKNISILISKINQLVDYDAITKLPNQKLFNESVQQEIEDSMKTEKQFALLKFKITSFRSLNDLTGQKFSDSIITEVAEYLKKEFSHRDFLARTSSDEFCILVRSGYSMLNIETIVLDKLRDLPNPISIMDNEIQLFFHIGVALYSEHGEDVETLQDNVETALYFAKDQNKTYLFFTNEMKERAEQQNILEIDLRKAITNKQISVLYQPQWNNYDQIIGVEALVRWHHPIMGEIKPKTFIPMAEKNGQIIQIGEWILREVCLQLSRWRELGYTNLKMAVNVSPIELQDINYYSKFKQILEETRIPAHLLEIEITENMCIFNTDICLQNISLLHELGVHISIDDFGTGYSSLKYLMKLPVHKLKIDRSFIANLHNTRGGDIVKSILNLANSTNLDVLAEGIETLEQKNILQSYGCNLYQGYYFGKPVSPSIIEELLLEQHCVVR